MWLTWKLVGFVGQLFAALIDLVCPKTGVFVCTPSHLAFSRQAKLAWKTSTDTCRELTNDSPTA